MATSTIRYFGRARPAGHPGSHRRQALGLAPGYLAAHPEGEIIQASGPVPVNPGKLGDGEADQIEQKVDAVLRHLEE